MLLRLVLVLHRTRTDIRPGTGRRPVECPVIRQQPTPYGGILFMPTTRTRPAAASNSFRRPEMREPLSANALTVLEKRYLKKDEKGRVCETPEEMFWRVSLTIAQEEARYGATPRQIQRTAEAFFHLLTGRYWLPNS